MSNYSWLEFWKLPPVCHHRHPQRDPPNGIKYNKRFQLTPVSYLHISVAGVVWRNRNNVCSKSHMIIGLFSLFRQEQKEVRSGLTRQLLMSVLFNKAKIHSLQSQFHFNRTRTILCLFMFVNRILMLIIIYHLHKPYKIK